MSSKKGAFFLFLSSDIFFFIRTSFWSSFSSNPSRVFLALSTFRFALLLCKISYSVCTSLAIIIAALADLALEEIVNLGLPSPETETL